MRTLKLAIIGFGNSGRALAKIILEKQKEIKNSFNYELKVTAIATASKGNLLNKEGIDLEKALSDVERSGSFDRIDSAYSELSTMEIIDRTDYDVMIEITPLNIFTGQPAIEHIQRVINRGKHVITANKGPIAWKYRELKALADKQKVIFLHETTVMDGTPIFNLVEETLPMCKILEINGILNTTTNFVLEEISKGKSYEEAIEEGKRRGFVEAEPSLDIEGWDAAAKTAALINVLMEGDVTPKDIYRKGIEDITSEDIQKAEESGRIIKLLCHGGIKDGKAFGRVSPIEIDKKHIFSTITGTSSVLSIKTDLMGEITVVEHDPEIEQTGYGLFSDLLRLIKKLSNI